MNAQLDSGLPPSSLLKASARTLEVTTMPAHPSAMIRAGGMKVSSISFQRKGGPPLLAFTSAWPSLEAF
ncbi:MAG: hypothetical protein QXK14_02290 [Acidilobaceae archaeon]